jgi:polysaccharide export outer membrane protein
VNPLCSFPLMALALAGLLAGCASSTAELRPPPSTAYAAPEYLIGAEDMIAVRVWQNKDLDVTVPVRSDGRITVPLIGDVQAGGRTPKAVADDIRGALAAYVREPQVSVLVTEQRSNEYLSRVRVTGAVREPVSLPYRPGMTVLDAVLAAGGPTEFAASDRASLHRRDRDATHRYGIALESMLEDGDLSSNYPVQPGDVITVPQRSF